MIHHCGVSLSKQQTAGLLICHTAQARPNYVHTNSRDTSNLLAMFSHSLSTVPHSEPVCTCPKDFNTWRTCWAAKCSCERVGSRKPTVAQPTATNLHWRRYPVWLPNTSPTTIPPTGEKLLHPICICAWRVGVWVSKFECLSSPPRCVSTHTQLALCCQWQNN